MKLTTVRRDNSHTNRDYNTNTATSVKNRKLLYSMQWHFLAQTDENVFLTMSQCHLRHNLEKMA